jgi:hypothetical protein
MQIEDIKNFGSLSADVIIDAIRTAGGLYRMNATGAVGYLFNPNKENTEVFSGMFYHASCYDRDEYTADKWSYYYSFSDRTIKNLETGEIYAL